MSFGQILNAFGEINLPDPLFLQLFEEFSWVVWNLEFGEIKYLPTILNAYFLRRLQQLCRRLQIDWGSLNSDWRCVHFDWGRLHRDWGSLHFDWGTLQDDYERLRHQ